MNIIVTSKELTDGQEMPQKSLCPLYKGIDLSPSLQWTQVHDAKSYALLCYDPDLPNQTVWIHWILTYIPKHRHSLPTLRPINAEHIILNNEDRLIQGVNSWGKYGWGGPCPSKNLPKIEHKYYFIIYALNTKIYNGNNYTFLKAISENCIGIGSLIGTLDLAKINN